MNLLISVLGSSVFQPLFMIYNGITNFPARIYASEDIKVAFLYIRIKSERVYVLYYIKNNFAMGKRK
jgi:predicted ATP-grasp superfamily ATP-dependent carboligase